MRGICHGCGEPRFEPGPSSDYICDICLDKEQRYQNEVTGDFSGRR